MSAICTHGCRWNPRGDRSVVAPAARAHEALTGHRVHVTDGHTSLWPRSMWAASGADSTCETCGASQIYKCMLYGHEEPADA